MVLRLHLAAIVVAALCAGCAEPGSASTADAGVGDAGRGCESPDASVPEDPVVRGEYLVRHVAGCGECHTPRLTNGLLDMDRWLAGAQNLVDLTPDDDTTGLLHAPNLTSDPDTGLGAWTDAEIERAFLRGISRDGHPLHPFMPYVVFHNMRASDAAAIVSYLRTVAPVPNVVPPRQPLPVPLTEPAVPLSEDVLPHTTLTPDDPTYSCALRGEYLATRVGECIACHTREVEPGTGILDTSQLLLGNRPFAPYHFGETPSETFADAVIYSKNLTPDEHGIAGWTPEQVRVALQRGLDDDGFELFPPMPSGAMAAFGGMHDRDALDIGFYLTTLAPGDNGEIPLSCTACHGGVVP